MIRQKFKKAVLAGIMCLSLVAGLIPALPAKADSTQTVHEVTFTPSSSNTVYSYSIEADATGHVDGIEIKSYDGQGLLPNTPVINGHSIQFTVDYTAVQNLQTAATITINYTIICSGVGEGEATSWSSSSDFVLKVNVNAPGKEQIDSNETPSPSPTSTAKPDTTNTTASPSETVPPSKEPGPQPGSSPAQQPNPQPASQPAAQPAAQQQTVAQPEAVAQETEVALEAVPTQPVATQQGEVAGAKHSDTDSVATVKTVEEKKADTEEPEVITLDVEDTKVAKDTLVEYAGKNVKLDVKLSDTAKWVIDASSIDPDKVADIDLGVLRDAKAIPQDTLDSFMALDELKDATLAEQISLVHDGPFGFSADLYMLVGEEYSGKYANLFYYNPETKAMEFVAACEVGEDGYATFPFVHASDYAVIVDRAPIGDLISNSANTVEMVDGTSEAVQSSEIDVEQQAVEGGARWIGVMMILLILTAVVVVFAMVHMIYKADTENYDKPIEGKNA